MLSICLPVSKEIRIDNRKPAVLALASGEIYTGISFGNPKPAAGEVVFNTSMSGYQEIATDPSYRGQLVCMTCTHIGNVGVNARDCEARGPQLSGLIVRELARTVSSWRAEGSLAELLADVAGITAIDTRALTRRLRDGGAVNGCIAAGTDEQAALALARSCPPIAGSDLGASAASIPDAHWAEAAWQKQDDSYAAASKDGPVIGVLDCGCKRAIMRELAARGFAPAAIRYGSSAADLAQLKPAGVVLSNGPGDPGPLAEAIDFARELLNQKIPVLAICLGHQVLALAAGAKIEKMKFGHHGSNHPVVAKADGTVAITSQNHGFTVAASDIPADLEITHTSLFDGSVQGLRHRKLPVMSFQGHPEASPGPREMSVLFDEFAKLVSDHAQA